MSLFIYIIVSKFQIETSLVEDRDLSKLFRKIALPFKQANRKMDDVRHRWENYLLFLIPAITSHFNDNVLRRVQDNVVQMKRSMSALTIDMDRRYGDFYNMTVVSLSILRLTMMWRAAFLLLNLFKCTFSNQTGIVQHSARHFGVLRASVRQSQTVLQWNGLRSQQFWG